MRKHTVKKHPHPQSPEQSGQKGKREMEHIKFTATATQLVALAECGILEFRSLSFQTPKPPTMAIATPWSSQAVSSQGDVFNIWKDGDTFRLTTREF